MINLEKSISERFPIWFEGQRARFTKPLVRVVSRVSRIDAINEFLAQNTHLEGLAFVEAALDFLKARYVVDQVEREYIPQNGRCVIVANHSLGAIDALALLHCALLARPDVKILANDFLLSLPGLHKLLIPLRTIGASGAQTQSLQAAHQALEEEQALILFPAGEVARWGWRGMQEQTWRRGFLKLAEKNQAPIIPVHISGRNSFMFYGASALSKPLATAMLPREMFSRPAQRIELRVGKTLDFQFWRDSAANDSARIEKIKNILPALKRGIDRVVHLPTPIRHASALHEQLKDLRGMQDLGCTPDGKRIYAGRLRADQALMREIARLRELSFRAVGEGTARAHDLDRFDAHYEQLLLWDETNQEIAGGYRVMRCAELLAENNLDALYSASLFEFSVALKNKLSNAMELGRSFVQPKYWGSRSLDYLWIGIGAYLRAHPEVRQLFGPVSISASLAQPARELLLAYYQKFYGDGAQLAQSANPISACENSPLFADLNAEQALPILRSALAAVGARIPTLYKQYTELCEPGGARFLAFGVDPSFANAVDGLIWVDLDQVTEKKRARYLDARPPKTKTETA